MTEHAVSTNGGYALRLVQPSYPIVRDRTGPFEATARPQGEPGAWATLLHNMNNDGAQGRVRVLENGDTYLYVGIKKATSDHSFYTYNVSSPSKLNFQGGINTWATALVFSAQQVPQFWPDQFPQFIGVNSGKMQTGGSTGDGGTQVLDLGPANAPYDEPLMGDVHSVFYGAFSGGTSTGITIQHGEYSYWGASFGFINAWNIEGERNNDLIYGLGETFESTYSGASESLISEFRRFMSTHGLVHHPTLDYVYDVGNTDYTIVWQVVAGSPGFITANAPPSGGVRGMYGLYGQPMLWGVDAVSGVAGCKLVFVDVSNPVAPTLDADWVIQADGTIMGTNYAAGMAQATYDHDKLLVCVRTGIGPYVYTLYRLDIVNRVILNTWVLEQVPPTSTPTGTFVTDGGAYYGWWDANGVYLMDLGNAPARLAATPGGNAERIRRK